MSIGFRNMYVGKSNREFYKTSMYLTISKNIFILRQPFEAHWTSKCTHQNQTSHKYLWMRTALQISIYVKFMTTATHKLFMYLLWKYLVFGAVELFGVMYDHIYFHVIWAILQLVCLRMTPSTALYFTNHPPPPLSYHTQPCLFTGIFCMRERSQPERTKWINAARWYLYVSNGSNLWTTVLNLLDVVTADICCGQALWMFFDVLPDVSSLLKITI